MKKQSEREMSIRCIYDWIRFGDKIKIKDKEGFDGYIWCDCDCEYIYWEGFGTSAQTCSLKNLKWIIREIFDLKRGKINFEFV